MTIALSPMVERLAAAVVTHADRLLALRLPEMQHNRAALAAWMAAQEGRVEGSLAAGGVTCFPRLAVPNVRKFCERLLDSYELLLVPGDCFGHPDRVRLGFGGAGAALSEGLASLAHALTEEAL